MCLHVNLCPPPAGCPQGMCPSLPPHCTLCMDPLGGSAVTPWSPWLGAAVPCVPQGGQCGREGGIRVLDSDATPYRS
eukprot:12886666-Alexandrium_andersonii.AAC.1